MCAAISQTAATSVGAQGETVQCHPSIDAVMRAAALEMHLARHSYLLSPTIASAVIARRQTRAHYTRPRPRPTPGRWTWSAASPLTGAPLTSSTLPARSRLSTTRSELDFHMLYKYLFFKILSFAASTLN